MYTAPISLLTPMLISLLHKPPTERLIRALILCCQYYLQVKDKLLFCCKIILLSRCCLCIVSTFEIVIEIHFFKNMHIYSNPTSCILKISDEMSQRMKELQTKIRSPHSGIIESEYRDNLDDLRLLVAKEYCTLLLGICIIFCSLSVH